MREGEATLPRARPPEHQPPPALHSGPLDSQFSIGGQRGPAAALQVCSCLALAGDGRMRAGKRLALAGGPESGSSCVSDIEAAPGDVGPAAATLSAAAFALIAPSAAIPACSPPRCAAPDRPLQLRARPRLPAGDLATSKAVSGDVSRMILPLLALKGAR